ncbi:MAG: hypothetical protein LBU39_06910 [Desulfobulbaceae bacterium]|jgi:hypothetical protein|nr:hypothetical protein [Desulfobulbaceae bacterium]
MNASYRVRYRLPGQWFWRRGKATADGFIHDEEVHHRQAICRYLVFADGGVIYLPTDTALWFGPERQSIIKERIRQEAGR